MLAALLSSLPALDPRFATNITVFHVNEHSFGAIPGMPSTLEPGRAVHLTRVVSRRRQ
jgi:hypothetical protein